jgi:hypothetical protein
MTDATTRTHIATPTEGCVREIVSLQNEPMGPKSFTPFTTRISGKEKYQQEIRTSGERQHEGVAEDQEFDGTFHSLVR